MSVLDCESVETTYDSLQTILGMSRNDIEGVFDGLDIDRFYEERPDSLIEPDELVFSAVTNGLPPIGAFDRVCWFHLTRTVENNAFRRGILPLGECIGAIWDSLYQTAQDHISVGEWNHFRQDLGSSESADLYREKVGNPFHWGPYGILIRDVAFKANEMGSHDYLLVPEIVEDICRCFAATYDVDLLKAFCENTKPCIIKFIHDETRQGYTKAALYYLYSIYSRRRLSLFCNPCFDAKGEPIPKKQILKIEFTAYP